MVKTREIEILKKLQSHFNEPIYLVGGYLRNYFLGVHSTDIDITGDISMDIILNTLSKDEYKITDINNSLGTAIIKDNESGSKFEYTRFRKESYKKGGHHVPEKIEFTSSLEEDAMRRDFRCNAIYYNLLEDKLVDILGGIDDIKNKILRTTRDAENVFSEDGLRIMRLARFKAELKFSIEEKTFREAKNHAYLLEDISKERITTELDYILQADIKYKEIKNNEFAHYEGLKVLSELGVFKYILPELEKGRGLEQRKDFHKYDVLEHTLQSVKYSHNSIRLSALMHDIGKPYCFLKTGVYHFHDKEGERIIGEVLNGKRLRYSKKVISEVKRLTALHMLDIKNEVKENKLRWYFVKNYDILDKLLYLKQADYLGCGIKTDISPTVIKWCKIINEMKRENVPWTKKELNVNALDIKKQYPFVLDKNLSFILDELQRQVVIGSVKNEKERLLAFVKGIKVR